MSEAIWGPLLSAVVVGLGSVLVYFQSRHANRTNEKKVAADSQASVEERADALMKYVDEQIEKAVAPLRQKLAEFEHRDRTRTNAFIRVLRSLFVQWPKDYPRPYLHRSDIADIEETIPPEWLPGPEE